MDPAVVYRWADEANIDELLDAIKILVVELEKKYDQEQKLAHPTPVAANRVVLDHPLDPAYFKP